MNHVMMISVATSQFSGLPGLHWLISFIIPGILILAWLAYSLVISQTVRKILPVLQDLQHSIEQYQGFDIELAMDVGDLFERCGSPALSQAYTRLQRDCRVLYQQRWLPDPARELTVDHLFNGLIRSSLGYQPAINLASTGLITALISMLLRVQLPVTLPDLAAILPWPPLVIGLATGSLLAVRARTARQLLAAELNQLCQIIGRHVPVFSEQAGLAMLIDSFHVHDERLEQTLGQFTRATSRMSETDLVDGFRRSVSQVMAESVTPLISHSTETLNQLAVNLVNRQEQGMAELAQRFAQALTAELTAQMAPVHHEISCMTAYMTDVKNYIEYAMRALEGVHKEAAAMLSATQSSLQQMIDTSQQLNSGFGQTQDQIRQFGEAAEKITQLFSGQEMTLNDSLALLASQLQAQQQSLVQTIDQSGQILAQTSQVAIAQQAASGQYLETLQGQLLQLGNDLQARLADLLTAVRGETREVASQSLQFQHQTTELNQAMEQAMDRFTQQTVQYVDQTLQQFDQGLAAFVERLAYTTTEIQDAVDALPAVLRQGTQYH